MPNSSWKAPANCQWGSILRDTSDLFLQHLVQEQEHMPETNEENRPLQKKEKRTPYASCKEGKGAISWTGTCGSEAT